MQLVEKLRADAEDAEPKCGEVNSIDEMEDVKTWELVEKCAGKKKTLFWGGVCFKYFCLDGLTVEDSHLCAAARSLHHPTAAWQGQPTRGVDLESKGQILPGNKSQILK